MASQTLGDELQSTATSSNSSKDNVSNAVTTEQQLVRTSRLLVELMNRRDYNNPFFSAHISPSATCIVSGKHATGIDGFIHGYKVVADETPAFQTQIINGSAQVDEFRGIGEVLLSQQLNGHGAEERLMAGTILMRFERTSAGWLCQHARMIYGTPVFL